MDNSDKIDFDFLDLKDLDANSINELTAILRSKDGIKLPWDRGENNCNELSEQIHVQDGPKIWQLYEMEENMIKYEPQTNPSVLVTVPTTMQYSQHLVAPVYHHEWNPNMYINNIASDPNVHSYVPAGMTFAPNMFSTNNENQELPSMREGGRRIRGRGGKSYSRNINHASEIQAGYMGDPTTQYQLNMSYPPQYIRFLDPNVTSQQHPAAGQPIFFPPCHNNFIPNVPMPQQTHRVDYVPYHQSPTNTKYSRQSQSTLSQTNGESTKSTNHKSFDKKVQNVNMNKPSIHQTFEDDNNVSQTNIVTTVIVNNSNNSNVDSSINDVDENLTAINKDNNTKIDFKIEQLISKNMMISKNDIPCVNITSSIEVKQNGNDKEYDETISHIKTPNISTTSKPAAKTTDEELHNKEVLVKDKIKETPVSENTTEVNEVPISTSHSIVSTWASICKKTPNTLSAGTNKPTALITPNVIRERTDQFSTEKAHSTPKSYQKSYQNKTPSLATEDEHQKNDTSSEQRKSLNAEIPQIHCDDPITYRMGEFLLSYQMDKQTVSLLPRGLTNRSNYCYINSILQALLACPPFYNLLMALPHSRNFSRKSPCPLLDNMIKFVREFTPLPEGARLARKDRAQKRNEDAVIDIQSGVPFEPSYIYTMLKNTSSAGVFSIEGRQEDAEEFLSCLLNGISDEMLELMKLANSNDQKTVDCVDNNVNYSQSEEEWKVMGPKNKGSITRSTDFGRTPLSDIFRGQLRSRVSRATEQTPTDYVQPFFTLQLDIEKAESVKSALEILVGKDQLEGMTCSKTKQQIEAWKQVTLEELPVILILHLKWFDYKPDGCSKIVKSVDFPIDLRIETKLMSGNAKPKSSQKQRQYKLFAVTYHDGKEATKGHYVTDAFHVGYGGWVRYDDSSLKGVSEANVLNPQPPRVPYLLYYRRCDTIGNNQSNTTHQVNIKR